MFTKKSKNFKGKLQALSLKERLKLENPEHSVEVNGKEIRDRKLNLDKANTYEELKKLRGEDTKGVGERFKERKKDIKKKYKQKRKDALDGLEV